MRSPIILTLLASLKLVHAETTVTKRAGNCTALPLGQGPVSSPDSPYEFLNFGEITSTAKNAPTPSNYTESFKNLHASSTASNYQGYITLDSYDTNACALACTAKEDCQSINVFFERDPTLAVGSNCPNPPSTTTIKCVFWGSAVTTINANNNGYTQGQFVVAVAGSNGYYNERAGDLQASTSGSTTKLVSIPGSALLVAPLLVVAIESMTLGLV